MSHEQEMTTPEGDQNKPLQPKNEKIATSASVDPVAARLDQPLLLARLRDSVSFKIFLILFMILLLAIPVGQIEDLVEERSYVEGEARRQVAEIWGGAQEVGGLVLTVPFLRPVTTSHFDQEQQQTIVKKEYRELQAHFLPEDLQIGGSVDTEVRHRGIYPILVYGGKLTMKGYFEEIDFQGMLLEGDRILWDKAYLSLPLKDLKGIRESPSLSWNGKELRMGAKERPTRGFDELLQVSLPILQGQRNLKAHHFDLTLEVSGSDSLYFLPMGRSTRVHLESSWLNPSYQGNFLPLTHDLDEQGFEAQWKVFELSRKLPQKWLSDSENEIDASRDRFGVNFYFPVSHYQQTTRSIKYASLFFCLLFTSIFLFEVIGKHRVHPIQYLMVAAGICLFYLNLLSLSEHLHFYLAYALAALSSILLIGGYAKAMFENLRKALILSGLLAATYGFLLILLAAETFSLLSGSLGLFAFLAAVMYSTRKLDWYDITFKSNNEQL